MDDLISRRAAIEAIEEYGDRLQMLNWKENPGVPYKAYALNWCVNTIRDLPSAQPERKPGRWEEGSVAFHFTCSECGTAVTWNKYNVFCDGNGEMNFCPNCGSYNGGGDGNRE